MAPEVSVTEALGTPWKSGNLACASLAKCPIGRLGSDPLMLGVRPGQSQQVASTQRASPITNSC